MLGIRLDQETEKALAAMARRTGRPKSQIAREAIRQVVCKDDRIARARRQWVAICEREREDPEMGAALDWAEHEFDPGE
jgi:RHH-type rel operon transcriptional repressor/antitoxin RelB